MSNRLPRNVRVLGLASLLNDVASEMIFPLLPHFALSVLKLTKGQLGVVEGAADSAISVLKLYSGKWSDRTARRKRWVVVGYALAAVSRPLIAVALGFWQVLAVRVADRVGKGLRSAPRDALIVESTAADQRGRAFGFHRAMDHLGAAIGPLLGMAFLYFWPDQLKGLFALAAIPGALVVVAVVWGLREQPADELLPAGTAARTSDRAGAMDAGGEAAALRPRPRGFRRYLAALLLFSLGNSSDLFLLTRIGEMGVDPWGLQLLWTAFHVVKSSGNVLAGRAVDWFGPRPLLTVGWGVYALIYLAFGWAATAWQGCLLLLAYGAYYSLTEPAEKTLVAQLGIPNQMGAAYGWFNLVVGVAALPASAVFGWLYERFGAQAAFGYGAALALASMLVMATLPRGPVKSDLGR